MLRTLRYQITTPINEYKDGLFTNKLDNWEDKLQNYCNLENINDFEKFESFKFRSKLNKMVFPPYLRKQFYGKNDNKKGITKL